jgi:glyoxylate utilization-related uncharacterized protein
MLVNMFNIRQVLKRTYALIVPDDASTTGIPGWDGAKVQVLAAPAMGCEFVEYLINVNNEGKVSVPVQDHPEYVFYVLEGVGVLKKDGESTPSRWGATDISPRRPLGRSKGPRRRI